MRLPKKTQSPSLKCWVMKFSQLEQSPVCLDLIFPLISIILTQAVSVLICHVSFGSRAEVSNSELGLSLSHFHLVTKTFISF